MHAVSAWRSFFPCLHGQVPSPTTNGAQSSQWNELLPHPISLETFCANFLLFFSIYWYIFMNLPAYGFRQIHITSFLTEESDLFQKQYQDHDSVKYLPAKKMKSYAHIRKYAVRIRGNTVEWICVNVMKPAKETIKSNSQCIHTVKVTYDGKYK